MTRVKDCCAAWWPWKRCRRSFGLGRFCHGRGEANAAARHYRETLERDAGHLSALNNLGTLLLDAERFDEAMDCFRTATARAPGYVGAQFNLGNACLGAGQNQDAEKAFKEALDLAPGFARAHNNLGVAL